MCVSGQGSSLQKQAGGGGGGRACVRACSCLCVCYVALLDLMTKPTPIRISLILLSGSPFCVSVNNGY